jgi:hypothetical protein
MTNTTNAAPASTTHAACTHPKTKVDRARCRKARATSVSRTAPSKFYFTLQANGSKVTHYGIFNDAGNFRFACTNKDAKVDVADGPATATPSIVTCKNCVKNVTPTAYDVTI